MLEVEHPAAKVLVELAELQDREVGDGTTLVVIIAAELLKRANDLVRNKIHPTSIISGYRIACHEGSMQIWTAISLQIWFSTYADMEGEETFDLTLLGHAKEVVEERIADDDVIMIKGTKNTSAVSLILRGANDHMLDELERALHDALSIVKRTLESNVVVAGGGAVEAALSVYLEYLATTLGSREQLAIAEFAESLSIIPKVLAVNAAKDATELVAKLRAYHHTAQTKADKQHLSSMGLDLSKGAIRNNLEAGVIEPAMSKVKILQFATEAAITTLRIDDMIKLVKDE
ncbi:hypothetical protein NE237_031980 [Protea cynaroides]|uniref:T-complex protein 1 subunit alpha n=1 Tax=Protea cynaroides TaxID=273540 RepID=A0A9Q0L284_9MAGN|nr:hypothetical protein NE237_031980 [Protea cynaroides]